MSGLSFVLILAKNQNVVQHAQDITEALEDGTDPLLEELWSTRDAKGKLVETEMTKAVTKVVRSCEFSRGICQKEGGGSTELGKGFIHLWQWECLPEHTVIKWLQVNMMRT